MIKKLFKLKEKYQPVEYKANEVINKGQDIMYRANMMGSDEGKLSETQASAIIIRGMLKVGHGCLIEYMMHRKIKKELISLGLYKEDEIVIGINELNDSKTKVKVFIGDIDYRANIRKKDLDSLEVIFGNASFIALNSQYGDEENISSHIKNIKVVTGNLLLNDLTCPIDLVAVFGNTDLTFVKNMNNLNKFRYNLGNLSLTGEQYPQSLKKVGKNIIVTGEVVPNQFAFSGIEDFSGDLKFMKSNLKFSKNGRTYIKI